MWRKIEVDSDVWKALKKHAEPFEDTPNSVLRRLLLQNESKTTRNTSNSTGIQFPNIPSSIPVALQQILEVIYFVEKFGYSRIEATNAVARRKRVTPQTVLDKYCRQLGKKAFEIDELLDNLDDFQTLLNSKFPVFNNFIIKFFEDFNK